MIKFKKNYVINAILLITFLVGITFAEELVFYGDTIVYEYPPNGRGPAPETLVVLYTQSNEVSPWQPVPDFWESIWDIDLSTPFSITKFYKKNSYGELIIDAYPRAHWTGNWHYCFLVDAETPSHGNTGAWYTYCAEAIIAADPEINFADYAVQDQDVYVVVICVCPGGASGLFYGGYRRPTNDTFPNGETVYVRIHYAYRCDGWAQNCHIGLNIHEYGHNWLPDIYCNYYEMGSFCGHYGYGFCQYHSWIDLIPSPIDPQFRSEIIDKNTLEPWLVPTEITETQLDYPIMPMQETYNGEVIRIKINASEQMLNEQSFIITNHQSLAPYEENFPDSGLLIWHIRDLSALGYWYNNRRAREIDVECAHGLWQWDSTEIAGEWQWWPTTEDPIYGTDSLDMFNRNLGIHGQGVYPPTGSPDWKGFGSATCMWDTETYNRFDAFTNPPSNLYDKWHGPLYPEYIHSHFALRNIHPDPIDETIVRADILLNYVQSDVATATSYNNSRNIVSDAAGNVYMVYEVGSYIYFTSTNINTMIWEPAFPVGKGKSPTIALDNNDIPNIIWVSNDSLLWSQKQNYYTWPREVLYYSPGIDAYYCETPSLVFDGAGYGHIVFEKWVYANGPWSGLFYGKLNPAQPGSITWELVDFGIEGIRCRYPSIAVDGLNNPHVTWQKNDEIYYRERQEDQHPPWQDIVNISNSSDLSYTPFVEIAANWLHIVWVEQPQFNDWSNIRHRRRDLSTGRWYLPQWVNNSNVYSKLPQTICGDQIVWSEELTSTNYEIYHSSWIYEKSSWGRPENISNTTRNSTAPQVTEADDDDVSDPRYLVTIWCEDDEVLYEVRKDKRLLPNPRVQYYIDLGREVQSPYTVERDGFFAYGLEDYKNVDCDSIELLYRITGFEDEYEYQIKFVFYHEGNASLKLKMRIDNVVFNSGWVHPYELKAVEGAIPESFITDGEIVIADTAAQGDHGVLSSIIVCKRPKRQHGGPQMLLDIEHKTRAFSIRPSIVNNNAEIHYQINSSSSINISIFDISGRKVKTLIKGNQDAGYYTLNWDAADDDGKKLSKGVYFIYFEDQNETFTKKIVIVK